MTWIVLLAVMAFAAALVAVGIRGRRINDHPICRACGFDVVGIYPANQRCPECGASLVGPFTVRTGHRRLRRGPLVVGSLLLFAGLVAAIAAGASAAGTFDWNTIKPEWLLAGEMRYNGSIPARDELIRRQRNGELSPANTRMLVDKSLDVHGDPNQNWDVVWSTFLADVWMDGLLRVEDLSRYAEQAVQVSLAGSPRGRPGWYVHLPCSVSLLRIVEGPEPIHVMISDESALIDGHEQLRVRGGGSGTALHPNTRGWSGGLGVRVPDLAPGVYPVRHRKRITFRLGSYNAPPFHEFEHVEELEMEVVPVDTRLVEVVTDAELGRQLRDELGPPRATIRSRSESAIVNGQRRPSLTNIALEFAPTSLPVNIAFDIYIRCGDRTVRLGTLCWTAGRVHFPLSPPEFMHISDLECDAINITLRPSIERAEAAGMDRIWGDEIIYEDVRLDPAAPRPVSAPR